MTNLREIIEKEARRIAEDSLYSAKGQFEAASTWGKYHLMLGIPTTVLAGIAGASALAQFDNHNIIAGILAIIVAALTALVTFLNPNEKANSHLNAGNSFLTLRNSARMFYEIGISQESSDEKLIEQLKTLANRRVELNQSSPQVSRGAFERARRGIEEGEAKYEVDSQNQNET
ncbi:MAG: SLATT domain-containing protein [Candidatus Bathyarchaeota archaeon]